VVPGGFGIVAAAGEEVGVGDGRRLENVAWRVTMRRGRIDAWKDTAIDPNTLDNGLLIEATRPTISDSPLDCVSVLMLRILDTLH
jgi:hypothetical protein